MKKPDCVFNVSTATGSKSHNHSLIYILVEQMKDEFKFLQLPTRMNKSADHICQAQIFLQDMFKGNNLL